MNAIMTIKTKNTYPGIQIILLRKKRSFNCHAINSPSVNPLEVVFSSVSILSGVKSTGAAFGFIFRSGQINGPSCITRIRSFKLKVKISFIEKKIEVFTKLKSDLQNFLFVKLF